MTFKKSFSVSPPRIWLVVLIFLALLMFFGVYVYTEKQIDRANELRQRSYLLASQLRQSSDDLTRMAVTYVVTGDPRYKKYYQDILDIRDGRKPRPEGYSYAYWDMVLGGAQSPHPVGGQAIALLDLIRRSGFSGVELGKLAEAKANSDSLTALEFEAMKLVESVGPDAEANRTRARMMPLDENYHQAKAKIMQPINEFYLLMDKRTLAAVNSATDTALRFRLLFLIAVLAAVFMLWRTYTGLRATLGGSAEDVHAHILRIGLGDFSTPIRVTPGIPGMERSVLAGLSKMQSKLYANELERKQAEEQFRIAAITFETHEAIMIADADANIIRVNRAFEKVTGYSAEEVLGKNPRILSSGRHDKTSYADMWREVLSTGVWSGEVWDRHKNGNIYPKHTTITAVKDANGETTQYVAIFTDITERKKAEEEINNLAFNDALTGLPNRGLLLERLGLALSVSGRNELYGALMFLDMDQLKTINDTLGHDYGDMLLVEVAQRLKLCVREVDTVARIGGDEFVLLIENVSATAEGTSQHVAQVAEKVRAVLATPYQIRGSLCHSSPSIGVCLFYGNNDSVDELIKYADMAMYQAKYSGRNRVRFFDPYMQ